MPLDCYETSTGIFSGDAPDSSTRLLLMNYATPRKLTSAEFASGFPTLSNNRPNPLSARPGKPASNMFTPFPLEAYEPEGAYIVSSDTTKNFEQAPNFNLRITQGGTENIDIRVSGTTRYFASPYEIAAVMQTEINDRTKYPTLTASDFTVTYSGDITEASPKYRFTIASGTSFGLTNKPTDPNSCLQSIGITGSPSSVLSIAGGVAIHTEETFTLLVSSPIRYFRPDLTPDTALECWRWLVFRNLNLSKDAAMTLYLDNTGLGGTGNADDAPASAYVNHLDSFSLLDAGGQLGTWEGADGGIMPTDSQATSMLGNTPARYYTANIAEWRKQLSSSDGLGGNRDNKNGIHVDDHSARLQIKIVDPTNPTGRISIGHMIVAPGFYGSQNAQWGRSFLSADGSELRPSVRGAYNSRYGKPTKKLDLEWGETYLTDLDQLMLDVSMRPYLLDLTVGFPLVDRDDISAGRHNVVVAIDPAYLSENVATAAFTAGGQTDGLYSTKYARGTILGHMIRGDLTPEHVNIWTMGQSTILEV